MIRTATTTASKIEPGSPVHHASTNRHGIVTSCNGRTVQFGRMATGAGAVTCRSCIEGAASGRIMVAEPVSA